MNELVRIETRELAGAVVATCNARDLWQFVESRQEFANWIKGRIEKYGLMEGEDFTVDKFINGRATIIDYHITIETAKEQPWANFSQAEIAWTNLNRPAALFRESATRGTPDKQHPTQKPLSLMLWCLSLCPPPETVLDPFMGSGTTGVACAMLGKAFTGVERERRYFDTACERIARAQAQGQLLPPAPVTPPHQQGLELT